MHRYPLRLSRNYWRIPLYALHQCTNECDVPCPATDCIVSTVIHLHDFNIASPQTQDGLLYDPDLLVIPDLSFTVLITFPFTHQAEIPLTVSEPVRLDELIEYIKTIYMMIYDVEERTATPTTFYTTTPCACVTTGLAIAPASSTSSSTMSNSTKKDENEGEGGGEEDVGDVCSICHDEFGDITIGGGVVSTRNCSHLFHGACLASWAKVKNTCPLCRVPLCNRCDADRNILAEETHVVLPRHLRSIADYRNSTNGIYGIHTCDIENIIITDMYYNRMTKTLQVHADTDLCALLTINPWYLLLLRE
jgi:hypothetical protein